MTTAASERKTAPPALSERRKITFEEFLAWDGDGNPELHAEWVDGEVVPMVSIDIRHTLISVFLIKLLGLASDLTNIGVVLFNPFVMRPAADANGRSPDVMLVRAEHKGRIDRLYLNGPADIAIEIISPGSIRTDYVVKAAEYRRAGVQEYWIIDPVDEQTTLYVLGSDGQYTGAELDANAWFQSPGLNGLAINPAWFYRDPLPDVTAILREWGILPTE